VSSTLEIPTTVASPAASPLLRGFDWRAPLGITRSLILAFGTFALLLLILGKNPISAYTAIFSGALGNGYSIGEVFVKLIPFVLCALAATIPARVGLVNVGAEGQLYLGAWLASYAALNLTELPAWLLIPVLMLAGFAGGAAWAGISGVLRVRANLNETISSLLLNYVGILVVDHFVHGPWKQKSVQGWPFTAQFVDAARLPAFFGSRVHLGIVFALAGVALTYFILRRTRWGFDIRIVGGNPEAARRSGIPINRYLLVAMAIGGGMAGLAGMCEVTAIQGRLRPGISNGYGYIGFLASWLANHNPLWTVATSALLAIIVVGGDVMQVSVNLPSASIDILTGLLLFFILGRARKAVTA